MEEHIYKRHNKSLLLYHIVLPVKYRKSVITEDVGLALRDICLEISERYEICFVEIGYEEDHVHFLVQSVPSMSVSEILRSLKSITAKELFRRCPYLESQLWGGSFWTSGYYANTVGPYGNQDVIQRYIENQGKTYTKIYDGQLSLFD
jgi:REP element-mobilizing transposase RayT